MRKNNYTNSKFLYSLLFAFLSYSQNSIAQTDTSKHSIEIQIFANVGLEKKRELTLKSKYKLSRTLLIYKYEPTKNLFISVAGDTYLKDKNKALYLTPYLKRAYLQYHQKSITAQLGLIVLEQFKYQRKIWQLRYIDKTFQNKFNYGENRSIGALIIHRPNKKMSFDYAIVTGYYTPNKWEHKYSLSFGQTFKVGFVSIRFFNSISIKTEPVHVNSVFITKSLPKTIIGLEVANEFVYNSILQRRQHGASIFLNQKISKLASCFTRYDINQSKNKTGTNIYLGLEFKIKEHAKIAVFDNIVNLQSSYFGLSVFYIFC
jgi:hypothetical protein